MVRRRRAELCQMRPPNATVRLPINSSGSGDLAFKSPESARNDANRHWPATSAALISGSAIDRSGVASDSARSPGPAMALGAIEISAQPAT
jgi:hypothetical protein